VTYKFVERTAVCGDCGKKWRGFAFETKDTTSQIFRKHILRRTQQSLATLALSEQLNSKKDFRLRN
jgi:hypothetical protein